MDPELLNAYRGLCATASRSALLIDEEHLSGLLARGAGNTEKVTALLRVVRAEIECREGGS